MHLVYANYAHYTLSPGPNILSLIIVS